MKFLSILAAIYLMQLISFNLMALDAAFAPPSNASQQLLDEDDDIDPYDDDAPHIKYPVKSLTPKAAMDQSSPKIITDEQGSGSGASQDNRGEKVADRVENLEKYLILLSHKLNRQETTNKELLTAIAVQQQQHMQEKSSLTNAISSLQQTVSKLTGRVNEIPQKLKQAEMKKSITSAIKRISSKLRNLSQAPARSTSELLPRKTESSSQLLGEMLGKEASNALSLVNAAGTNVPISGGSGPPASVPVINFPASQPRNPSTPTGQGPVGSVSSNSVGGYVAVKSPANVAGYNILPLTSVSAVQPEPAQLPQVPLDPPSIGLTQKADPTAVVDELPAPGSISPFEVLTTEQLQPKASLAALPASSAAHLPVSSLSSLRELNALKALSKSRHPASNDIPVAATDFDKISKDVDAILKKYKLKGRGKAKHKEGLKAGKVVAGRKVGKAKETGSLKGSNRAKGDEREQQVRPSLKTSSSPVVVKSYAAKLYKDHVLGDLKKALKIGSFRKVERPAGDLMQVKQTKPQETKSQQQQLAKGRLLAQARSKVINKSDDGKVMKRVGVIIQSSAEN
eukprot:gene16643-18333_t